MPLGCGGAAAPRSNPRGGGAPPPPPPPPPGPVPDSAPRRGWGAKEEWLDLNAFKRMLSSPPYYVIQNCDSWRPASPLAFPASRAAGRAVQAVEVVASRRRPAGGGDSSSGFADSSGGGGFADSHDGGGGERVYRFTFVLERVEAGGLKGCWLTVGVRVGDYSL